MLQVRSRHSDTCRVVVESRLSDPVWTASSLPPAEAAPQFAQHALLEPADMLQVHSRHLDTCRVVVESRLYDPVVDGQ